MKNLRFLILLLSMSFALVSCKKDEPNGGGEEETTELKGSLSTELTLKSGKTYDLIGGYHVKNGGKLIIEPGVTIKATNTTVDYILIEQGGQISANGTKEKPIVMTSVKKESGAWGGLHICGKAPINLGKEGKSEIGDAVFGGTAENDNSGTLKYVRLEYTGYAFSETKESNGLTMYGVGNGTTIEYVQVYKGADDGFEWFGGTVNAKYLVSTYSGDDSFDWTDGWIGKGQFWLAVQDKNEGDCLIEADNRENNFTNTPVSNPTIANITLIGNSKSDKGVRLRAGTNVKMYNALITGGKANSVYIETNETAKSFTDGKSEMEYVHMNNVFKYKDIADLGLNTKTGNAINQDISLNGYIGTIAGGKVLSDAFFTNAPYKGAVAADNDWTAGWTITEDVEENTELKGTLSGERTLKAGKTYTLIGGYHVKDGGKLNIQEGVTINATCTTVDYILIEQGGQINAVGTKDKPIVMTAVKKESGAWGGLHICGKAPINLGKEGKSEIGDAPFGGTVSNDNSGTIKYVRLEYTGYAFSETKESNGLTMYGVGNGTTIEYVQTYMGADDGFEWFGGTVNAKYLVSTGSGDDSFDWTDGWVGKGQFWVADQIEADGDCLIEADNRENNFANTPVSNPTIANITLIGNSKSDKGIRLRAGTNVKLYNALITGGKANSVYIETAETTNSFKDGKSTLEYVYANKVFTYKVENLALETKNNNAANQTIALTGYIGTVDGGKDLSADSYFVKATYKGAVATSNDWTAGWTLKK